MRTLPYLPIICLCGSTLRSFVLTCLNWTVGIKEFDHCDLQDLHPSSPFASGTQSLSSSSDTLPSSPPSSAGSPDYCPPSPSLSSGSSDYEPSAPPRRSRKPSPRKKASARNRQDSHKNPASGRVRRPPNAFIIFRSNVCKKTKVKGPAKKNNQTTTSCAAAILWNSLSDAEKAPWATRAAEAKAQHKLQHPDYKYTPGKAHKAKSGKRGPRPTKLEISRSETMAKLLGQGFEGAELNRHLELIYGEANSPLPSSSRTRGPHVSQSTSKRATKSRTTKVSDFEGDFQPEVAFENMHISDMATPELVASSPESDDGQLPQEVSTPSSSVSHEVQVRRLAATYIIKRALTCSILSRVNREKRWEARLSTLPKNPCSSTDNHLSSMTASRKGPRY